MERRVFFQSLLDALFPPVCAACGAVGSGLCPRCAPALGGLQFTLAGIECSALGEYDGALRRAVLALKAGRRDVASAVGALLGTLIAAYPGCDALVPVPTTGARRRERGFDQATLLATHAARAGGHDVAIALRRLPGRAQQGRSRPERLAATGRFAARSASLGGLSRVLLVDDVATTGATLRDAAAALARCGVLTAGAIVAARTADERRPSTKEPASA